MDQMTQLLQQAQRRGEEQGLPYRGALTPQEAHQLKQAMPEAVLLDVRSAAEWQFVGVVPYAQRLEWRSFPGMQPNPRFLEQLQSMLPKGGVLMLMCRSGVRSDEVARMAAAAGFTEAYNVLEGFEGDKDAAGHRNTVGGWKARGLPWQQG
ncbi:MULTISPECIES: rhodanese-like domain-containing protein [Chromobacterium]|uniref:rhodanese-like domain-containing protein n=1 Tax=Chromobacterium TaxID=535 RepID=UPI000314C335|nr:MULTISPECIES: rhodanese-like domain-containing protein [Chromobacterium]MDH0341249.1 rhodanese-like domain-containing protein [Chromobacterium haemolyticum]PTU71402.1 rhodanese-like domain-containing protein [Chromobacterium haemolyticum]QOD81562.1 rhodanese-like domain-containing protein [Chromobacterium haemolyticum]BBH14151.1 rhodanese [Chromobacterium haemolyticum]